VKIDGYQTKDLGKVAQTIQRSGYPDAYDTHVADARTLASAITGETPASFRCVAHVHTPAKQPLRSGRLTGRAAAVRTALIRPYGSAVEIGGSGVQLTLTRYPSTSGARMWAVGNFVMANAKRLEVASIRYGTIQWRIGDASEKGWTPGPATSARTVVVTVLNGSAGT
jgi:hypothetical protein